MQHLEQLIRIQDKMQQMLRRYELLQKENERLKKELKESNDKLDEQLKKTQSLEQSIAVLKTVSGKMNDEDKKDLEKRLNHYLKEIDRCIGILSE